MKESEAWIMIAERIERFGMFAPVIFHDSTVEKVIDKQGISTGGLCSMVANLFKYVNAPLWIKMKERVNEHMTCYNKLINQDVSYTIIFMGTQYSYIPGQHAYMDAWGVRESRILAAYFLAYECMEEEAIASVAPSMEPNTITTEIL